MEDMRKYMTETNDTMRECLTEAKSVVFDGKNHKDLAKFLSKNGFELNKESNGKSTVEIDGKEQGIFKEDELSMKGKKLVIKKRKLY